MNALSCARLSGLVLGVALLLGLPAMAEDTAQPAPTTPTVTAAEALAAWDRFRAAPAEKLAEAPTFLKFMQSGGVHTVLRNDVVFWMYQPYPQDLQAVLYAAYMGGNLDSQLRGKRQGDDPEAGMRAALDAWAGLKKSHPKLSMPQLDEWEKARQEGRLAAALEAGATPPQR
jgi:hypothetical protein